MAYRRHKSTKVPGVKLRPRPSAGESTGVAALYDDDDFSHQELREARLRAHDERQEIYNEEVNTDEDAGDLPLSGAVFCFTGISEEKTKLAQIAYQLGAEVEGALTESTTHLVANAVGSIKYQCSLRLGLFILRPSFLEECAERWRDAKPLNLDSLLVQHSLKPLQGLFMGVCGISGAPERDRTRRQLEKLGAEVTLHMNFEKHLPSLTHIICFTNSLKQSNTLHQLHRLRKGLSGSAEERRDASQIKCIWPEWIQDCENIQGCIPEAAYDIWETRKSPSLADRAEWRTIFPKRSFKVCKQQWLAKKADNLAHIEQVIQAEEERKRLASGVQKNGVLKKSLHGIAEQPAEEIPHAGGEPKTARTGNFITSLSREVSEVAQNRSKGASAEKAEDATTSKVIQAGASDRAPELEAASTFAGLTIRIDLKAKDLGKTKIISGSLRNEGCKVVTKDNDDTKADFCICSLDGPSTLLNDRDAQFGELRTYLWFEQCLFFEQILPLSPSSPYFEPAGTSLPVPEAQRCVMALTGFPAAEEHPERSHLARSLEALGCQVSGDFKRKSTTHLLSGQPASAGGSPSAGPSSNEGFKAAKAREWGIPVVGLDFVARMWKEAKIEPPPSPARRNGSAHSQAVGESLSTLPETQGMTEPLAVAASDLPRAATIPRADRDLASTKVAAGAGEASREVLVPETLAGQSMWAARMGNEVNALLASHNKRRRIDEDGPLSARSVSDVGMSRQASGDQAASSKKTALWSRNKAARPRPSSRRAASTTGTVDERSSPDRHSARSSMSPTKGIGDEGSTFTDVADLLARRREIELLAAAGTNTDNIDFRDEEDPMSIRVTYRDPAAEKERKKLEELFANAASKSDHVTGGKAAHGASDNSEGSRTIRRRSEEETGDVQTEEESVQPGADRPAGRPSENRRPSPLTARTPTKSHQQPPIKARKQPGTSGRR